MRAIERKENSSPRPGRAASADGRVVVVAHDPWFGFPAPEKNDSCLASSSHRLDARCREFQRQHDDDDASRMIRRGDFVRAFVRTHGVSHESRPRLWLAWSGADAKREASVTSYAEALANAESRQDLKDCFAQIEMDLERTFPEHAKFAEGGEALPALRRVLRALSASLTSTTGAAEQNLNCGYVQGMNYLAGFLLVVMDEREDDAYWVLRCVVEDMFPGFYDAGLGQLRSDLDTLDFRFSRVSREAHAKLNGMGLAVKYFTARWLMCCLIGCASVPLLTRVWDLLFVDADRKPRETILRCSLGILALQAPFIRAAEDMNVSVECIREAGNNIDNIDAFLQRVSDLREMNFPTTRSPAVDSSALATPARKRAKFHAPPPTPARVAMTPVGNSTWSNLVAFFSPTPSKPAPAVAPPLSVRASAMKPTRLWSFDTASPRKTPPTSSFRHREGVENVDDTLAVELSEVRKSGKHKRGGVDDEYATSPIFAKSPRMARTPPIAKSPLRSPLGAMR